MNNAQCKYEREIIVALKTGSVDQQSVVHLKNCSVCQTSKVILEAMEQVRAFAIQQAPAVPSYRLLWHRAQYVQRQERLSMVDLIRLLGMSFVGALGVFGVIFWKFPHLVAFITTNEVSFKSFAPLSIPVALIIVVVVSIWVYSIELFLERKQE